jgi:hypothetical protein
MDPYLQDPLPIIRTDDHITVVVRDPFATHVCIEEGQPPIVIANVFPTRVLSGPGDGVGGDLHYRFPQATPASRWYILHKLGKMPSVSCRDSAGNQIEGDVEWVDLDRIIIDFGAQAFSGEAFLN